MEHLREELEKIKLQLKDIEKLISEEEIRCPYCNTPYSGELDENGDPYCDCDDGRLERNLNRLDGLVMYISSMRSLPPKSFGHNQIVVWYDRTLEHIVEELKSIIDEL